MYKYLKRVLDLVLSLLLLPLVLIIGILVGSAIKFEDGGPVFYFSNRIGKNGRIFKMFKFRSMKVNAPDIRLADGSTFNSENDTRITKVGSFIRKTSIDELPQILNIIRGDMSFIGPRPDSAMWLPNYTEEERIILSVLPGLTGLNQVMHRNSVGTKEKLQNDIIYVKNLSLWMDIKILLRTITTVFTSRDVYRK